MGEHKLRSAASVLAVPLLGLRWSGSLTNKAASPVSGGFPLSLFYLARKQPVHVSGRSQWLLLALVILFSGGFPLSLLYWLEKQPVHEWESATAAPASHNQQSTFSEFGDALVRAPLVKPQAQAALAILVVMVVACLVQAWKKPSWAKGGCCQCAASAPVKSPTSFC